VGEGVTALRKSREVPVFRRSCILSWLALQRTTERFADQLLDISRPLWSRNSLPDVVPIQPRTVVASQCCSVGKSCYLQMLSTCSTKGISLWGGTVLPIKKNKRWRAEAGLRGGFSFNTVP
jgi:hypothetical protein